MLKHIPFYASLLDKTFKNGIKPKNGMVLVYGAVEAHSFGERGCIASNKTIAEECGLKEGSVATYLSAMSKEGWIQVYLDENNHRILIVPLMVIEPPFNYSGTPLPPQLNIDNSNKNTVIEKTSTVKKKLSNDLLEVINKSLKREFRTLPRGYQKTLDLFSIDEIERALVNLSNDAWHHERLPQLKLDYLIRATTIDKFLLEESVQKSENKRMKLNLDTGKMEEVK